MGWHSKEFARVHYALEKHRQAESLSQRLFDSIREKTYTGPDELVAWAEAGRYPILARGFKETLASKEAHEFVAGIDSLASNAMVDQLPTFVVNGKYRVSVLDGEPGTLAELETLLVSLKAER